MCVKHVGWMGQFSLFDASLEISMLCCLCSFSPSLFDVCNGEISLVTTCFVGSIFKEMHWDFRHILPSMLHQRIL